MSVVTRLIAYQLYLYSNKVQNNCELFMLKVYYVFMIKIVSEPRITVTHITDLKIIT